MLIQKLLINQRQPYDSFTFMYFLFLKSQVWFLEDEKLPVVSNSLGGENTQKILMKSPWEILQTSVGSGGVISLLSSENILDNLSEMGVEYIEVR